MAKNTAGSVIIIKKVKKGGGHAAHHGGAWKVAYADFVTAMMAFFLLLWLLNVTTDVQKRGIADYFDPTLTSKSTSGAGGVLGGQTIGQPGSEKVSLAQPNIGVNATSLRQPLKGDDSDDDGGTNSDQDGQGTSSDMDSNQATPPIDSDKPRKLTADEFQKQLEAREQQRFEEAKKALEAAVTEVPELQALAKNLLIDETSEGLRIQIVDQDKTPMYPLGSAEMLDPAKKLIALVTQVVQKLPNKISITGHTDATQYAFSAKYTNWELSADRANASRREFLADGLQANRIERVVGVADQDPLEKNDPAAPDNRRISIVLLRHDNAAGASAAAPAAAPTLTKQAAAAQPASTPPAN